jgi:hypothetical protein
MLNKFKKMKGFISIYIHLGTLLKEIFKETFVCASNKETF